MNPDLTYQSALKNHAALKALGQTKIHLFRDGGERPWKHVTSIKPGGSHRLDIETSVHIEAIDPKTKLQFTWIEDIEERAANGKGHYEIAAQNCQDIMAKLPPKPRQQFAEFLAECAGKVKEKAREWQGYADRQFRDAAILEKLASDQTDA